MPIYVTLCSRSIKFWANKFTKSLWPMKQTQKHHEQECEHDRFQVGCWCFDRAQLCYIRKQCARAFHFFQRDQVLAPADICYDTHHKQWQAEYWEHWLQRQRSSGKNHSVCMSMHVHVCVWHVCSWALPVTVVAYEVHVPAASHHMCTCQYFASHLPQ